MKYINNTLIRHKLLKYQYRFISTQDGIAAGYKPNEVEKGKYLKWIDDQKVEKQLQNGRPKFSMILPPPNVTGYLHLGHALMCTIQDVLCRRKKQQGFNVSWIPGTDHAGIATQIVVEKKIVMEKNISRHELGREKFLEKIWKWKNDKGNHIIDDLKKMGCSLDWEQEYFTMDENRGNAVTEAFIRLFNEGLIQRKKSLVNWSCTLQSAISDIEVETKEINGPISMPVPGHNKNVTFGQLYDIAYKIESECECEEEIIVSTTRPETLLGDVAVAVHPEDSRYSKYYNKGIKLFHPFRYETIPLIFDDSINKEFGTGAVKITPAHDKDDFERANNFQLPIDVEIFTVKGEILDKFSDFAKMPRFEAREKILNELDKMCLLKEIKPHKMNLPMCSRSNDVIEYMLKPQWFLNCQDMATEAIKAVRNKEIKIFPTNYESEWYRWLQNTKDWCISRQLWWGHQIPAYLVTADNKEEWIVARSEMEAMVKAIQKFQGKEFSIQRDADVLDTWFSSSLLSFSTFGWPNDDIKNNYPLDLMETGHDILFFWVARMVMMGIKLTGAVPFRNILLHGVVCDAHGRKMSKSLGNIVHPGQVIYGVTIENLKNQLESSHKSGIMNVNEFRKSLDGFKKHFPNGIPECGTDALRFTLCSHNINNHFINFDVNECYTNKLFFNKIWQATRYTLNAMESLNLKTDLMDLDGLQLGQMDRWILSRLGNTRKLCNHSFDNYNFHLATTAIKTFFYSNFCDVYLETTKYEIYKKSDLAVAHCTVLSICLSLGLQIMSPITPFLSEELLKYFPKFHEIIDSSFINDTLENEVKDILEICTSVRQLKSRENISKKHDPKLHLFPQSQSASNLLAKYRNEILALTLANGVFIEDITTKRKNQFEYISTAGHLCSFAICTNDTYSKNENNSVLNQKKLDKLQNGLGKLLKTISSDGYKKSANESVQKKHLEKIRQIEIEITNIKQLSR